MKKINNDFKPQTLDNELIDPEYKNQLLKQFITPLNKRGFELETYTHVYDHDNSCGTHILCFNHINKSYEFTRTELDRICIQDDDNQPFSTYSLFCGTLHIYIPYFA